MSRIVRAAGSYLLLAAGCTRAPVDSNEADTGTPLNDSDTEVSTDTSDSSDASDSSNTGDSEPIDDTASVPFCDQDLGTAPAPGTAGLPTCITGALVCGDVIEASTAGGSTHFNLAAYTAWGCGSTEPPGSDYDAAERAYVFAGAQSGTKFTLDKACDTNLNLRVIRRQPHDPCGTADNTFMVCSRDPTASSAANQTVTITQPGDHDVVVDARDGAEANFRLIVECSR